MPTEPEDFLFLDYSSLCCVDEPSLTSFVIFEVCCFDERTSGPLKHLLESLEELRIVLNAFCWEKTSTGLKK